MYDANNSMHQINCIALGMPLSALMLLSMLSRPLNHIVSTPIFTTYSIVVNHISCGNWTLSCRIVCMCYLRFPNPAFTNVTKESCETAPACYTQQKRRYCNVLTVLVWDLVYVKKEFGSVHPTVLHERIAKILRMTCHRPISAIKSNLFIRWLVSRLYCMAKICMITVDYSKYICRRLFKHILCP